jgi:glycosyltransferase involved in cell wall biosynthesis
LPTEPPRIGVDLRALVGRPSGIGFFTLSLLRHLAAKGTSLYRGLAHAPVYGEQELRREGIELEYQSSPLGVWWQQMLLPRRLASGDLDLFWSPLLTLPVRVRLPAVVTVHDLTTLLYPETHSLKVRLSVMPFIERSVEQARQIAADSEATARDLRRLFPQCRDKIRVVYPGVDGEFRPGSQEAIAATREELGCPEGYVLFVGTLEPRKNLSLLVEAWRFLRRNDPTTLPLVLAGPYGWRSQRLLRYIRSLESEGLHYLSHVDRERLVRLFQGARIFVLPSLYEGFGLPAVEAMACGVPTIVTETSSLPEVVGKGGLLVEVDDTEGLARTIRGLLEDRSWAGELAARGIEQAKRFDWNVSAEAMEEIFQLALQ